MTRLLPPVATAVLVFVIGACGEIEPDGAPAMTSGPVTTSPVTTSGVGSDADSLAGSEWVAVAIDEGASVEITSGDPAAPTLLFGSAGASVRGSTGCNSFEGTAIVGAGTLAVGPLSVTERACADQTLMSREAAYLRVLSSAALFALADGVLTLSGDGGSLSFVRPEPVVDAGLDDTLWTLTTLIAGDVATSVLTTTTPTMTIDTTGASIRGTTGCNDFLGTALVTAPSIAISDLRWTEVACEEGVMRQEAAILEVLQTADRVEIDGDRLTLGTSDGTALVYRAG